VWRVDIVKLIESLVRHDLLTPYEAYTDRTFMLVRNGYIALRKWGLESLESLVTALGRFDHVLSRFCRDFPKEVEDLLLIQPPERG